MIVIPSLPSMLLAHLGFRGEGSRRVREVGGLIEAEAAQGRRVLVHAMSNNGFFFLSAMMVASGGVLRQRLSGVVLDSCPCRITPEVAATGLLASVQRVDGGSVKVGGGLKGLLGAWLRRMEGRQDKLLNAWDDGFILAPALLLCRCRDCLF